MGLDDGMDSLLPSVLSGAGVSVPSEALMEVQCTM